MNKYFKNAISAILAATMAVSMCSCGLSMESPKRPEETPQTAVQNTTDTSSAPAPSVTAEPQPEITPEPIIEETITDPYISIGINEVMASNKSSVISPSGEFCDWIELYNYGMDTVDLSGYGIAVGDVFSPFENLTMAPGEYKVIYCTSNTSSEGIYANCKLSKNSCTVSLQGPHGTVIEQLSIEDAKADTSYYRNEYGTLVSSTFPTPGFINNSDGYNAYQETISVKGPLVINEVMSYNGWYYMYAQEYHDWLEVKNISDSELNLSDYYLSDDMNDLMNSRLPDVVLKPGQVYFVYCTGSPDYSFTNGANANFSISGDNDHIYLSTSDGTICDYMYVHDIPYHHSLGRMDGRNGSYYFANPTPGENNGTGVHAITEAPVLVGQDGIFNDVESVTVTLSGNGTIYYTTNGSTPTQDSTVYTGPFELSKTTPIRAICIEDGKLPSTTLNATYIINEYHTLPVVNIQANYNDLFGNSGLYTNPNREIEAYGAVTFYENGGSFTKECGIKLHGATSKIAQEKKSFKLCFRTRYDGELEYDVFNNGITEFSSILVRAAQEDYYSTLMRDTLMHQVAAETFPELPSQANKYSVLYVNGEYWGIYDLREAHSSTHYAEHYGYDENTVSQWKFQWPNDSSVAELYNFIMNNDMSNEANWEKVRSRLNLVSIADWSIIQAYCGNFDCNPDNARFYYSTEDDMLTYALVDLDLGFFSYDMFDTPYSTDYAFERLATRLLQNDEFKQILIDELHRALTTTLSDEAMLARIDAIEEELTPEIPRDRARWGSSLEKWQYMVDELRGFVNNNIGRARLLVNSLKNKIHLTNDQVEEYFSDIPVH